MSTPLHEFNPENAYLVGIDSDGCVFDSMELKHKECFCPQFIKHFDLQPVSKYAREVWDFVNLYSKSRGANRFKAVLRALELLGERPEVQARGVEPIELTALAAWVKKETKLGNPALEAYIEHQVSDDVERDQLQRALDWSLAVNQAVADMVRNVPPFPDVRSSLEELSGQADVIVVSQTPLEALEREWAENDLDQYAAVIAGQEYGTKGEHLKIADRDRYEKGHVLMVGDAPGDLSAAREAGALFFPILPGQEETSWSRFANEAIDRFLSGKYAGDYEQELIREFDAILPNEPGWKRA